MPASFSGIVLPAVGQPPPGASHLFVGWMRADPSTWGFGLVASGVMLGGTASSA